MSGPTLGRLYAALAGAGAVAVVFVAGLTEWVLGKDALAGVLLLAAVVGAVALWRVVLPPIAAALPVDEVLGPRGADALDRAGGIVDAAHDAVVIADRNGMIVDWNASAQRSFGWSRAEAVGRTLTETIVPDSHHRQHLAGMMRFREGKTGPMLGQLRELPARRKNGDVFPVEITITRIGSGEQAMLAAFIRDITDRRATERALRTSEERFRRLVETSGVVPWEGDPRTGNITYVGPQAEKWLGFPMGAWLEPGFWGRRIHDEDREYVLGQLAVAGAGGQPVEIEYRVVHRDGRLVWVRDLVTGEATPMGPVLRGFRFDITGRRRLEEESLQSNKLEAIGRLAGGVAHDFNNVLTSITGYAAMLEPSFPERTVERADLAEIRRAAAHAAELTQQLLAFARKQVIRPRVVVLDELVGRLEKMVRRLIGEDVAIVTRTGAGPAAVWVDPGRLEQALVNLVLNARDAMPRGGTLTLTTSVRDVDATQAAIESVGPGPFATIAVADTGTGMDRATLARIFEPFFTTKREAKGTGLGLSMTYGVLHQAGGFIQVDTQPQRGSTFTAYLPLSQATARAEEVPPAGARARGGRETILVAEDEPQVRALTERALLLGGYRVLLAQNGSEAVDRSRTHEGPIHLLITDVVMPVMGGVQAADTIRRERPGTRVLFLSGYSEDALFRDGVGEGVHFLGKPFAPDDLDRKVREILDGASS